MQYIQDIQLKARTLTSAFNFGACAADCLQAFSEYLDAVEAYIDDRVKINPSFESITSYVLKPRSTDYNFLRFWIPCNLLAMKGFFKDYLRTNLRVTNVENFGNFILTLIADVNKLICMFEKHTNNQEIPCTNWRREDICILDRREALMTAFLPERYDRIELFSFRDFRLNIGPLLRQSLETIMNSLIGFSRIHDATGRPVLKFTQAGWQFLSEKMGRGSAWSIIWPNGVTKSMIDNAYGWANRRTHNPWIDMIQVQYVAVEVYMLLVCSNVPSVKLYPVEITGYDALKTDFEAWVLQRRPDGVISWSASAAYKITP